MPRRLLSAIVPLTSIVLLAITRPASAQLACELQKLVPLDNAVADFFGHSVAILGDVLFASAHADDDNGNSTGSVYVYGFDGSTWIEQQKLHASDAFFGDLFGWSVALSGDLAVISAVSADDLGTDSGAAYIFRIDPKTGKWIEEIELLPTDGQERDRFGWQVAMSDDTVIVGADLNDSNGVWSGAAYTYRYDGAKWVEQKLLPDDGAAHDHFGIAVDIVGDLAIIGAWADADDDSGIDSGSAYIFRRDLNLGEWVQEAKLVASDGESGDWFGVSVGLQRDLAIIGARGDDDNGEQSGSAYVFRFDGSAWNEEAKLFASDAFAGDDFGWPVVTKGSLVAVGARFAGQDDTGAVYVFRRDEGSWPEVAKLLASDGATDDEFGQAITMDNSIIVIGADYDDDNGTRSGSAYVMEFPGSDCNGNGLCDNTDIADGTSSDDNANGIPDECECPPDLNGDGYVDAFDLATLLASWGPCPDPCEPGDPLTTCIADLDGNCEAGPFDLALLLGNWGPCE